MNGQFAEDVREGLSSEPKYLLSKYFYDKKGDELFQKIMNLDEYYLTDSEYEIFDNQKSDILKSFSVNNDSFDLIEFGVGDGLKTKVLVQYFVNQKVKFKYIPIDISPTVLETLERSMNEQFPGMDIQPICDDYFHALEELNKVDFDKKVILFLGSNIGNFSGDNAIPFLKHIGADMKVGDQLLIGFDLKKNPDTIINAYNDREGVTASFNYNLLNRINTELGGEFKEENFVHYPTYNPVTGETTSYLISLAEQKVYIKALSQSFYFEKWEPIFMEVSQKYSLNDINHLAYHSGFKVLKNFMDKNNYYADSLWTLI